VRTLSLITACVLATATARADGEPRRAAAKEGAAVSALGRLEPKDGILRIAGPSQPSVVIAELRVDEGERVRKGDVIAVLDSFPIHQATVRRLQVELENASNEWHRHAKLSKDGIVSISERENWETKVAMLKAQLRGAEVELALAEVRAPIDGEVLEVHARAGERVGLEGIVELGRTDQMYAIAEVYETDIGRVHLGQRAVVTSPAFAGEAHGKIDRIGLKIGKKDVLDTDPVAQTDARVVEVEILLDESEKVAHLTNLRVDVLIGP
jgi:HlyD family secretion protein